MQQARIGVKARVVDLLRLNTFRDARVRAGEDGLRRSITGVTVGEVPDQERFLRGGELILTSLYAYREATAEALRLFVETIDDHGAAALAFKPGRFVPDLPALVLHTANERSLPLVALRADVVWSDVISEVSSLLLSRAGAELATILTVEAELADALLGPGGLSSVASLLSIRLRGPVQIVDHHLLPVAASTDVEPADYTTSFKELGPGRPTGSAPQVVIHAGDRSGIARTLVSRDRAVGYLIVWGRTSFTDEEILIANRAELFCSLELAKRQATEPAGGTARGELLEDLLAGRVRSPVEFRQRLRILGHRAAPAYAVVIILPTAVQTPTIPRLQARPAPAGLALNELLPAVAALSTLRDGGLVTLWPGAPDAESRLRGEVKSFLERCRNLPGWETARAAIGRMITDPLSAHSSYQDALRCCEVPVTEETSVITADDFAVEQLFASLPKEDLQRFYRKVLGPLLDADRAGDVLLRTLSTYLASGCSHKATSTRLGIHRNTLTLRLRQIERLMGANLQDPTQLANLTVALQIGSLL